jgi:hypothetical protein
MPLVPIQGIDWLVKAQANEAAIAAAIAANAVVSVIASDAEAITGTSTTLALTPANLMAALAGLTFPISAAKTITSATPATFREVISEVTIAPATTLAIGSNGSIAGLRGSVILTTGKSLTDGFLYGTQGKLTLDGATVAVGPDHVAGLYGQLSMNGTTLTSGHIAGVISDIQGTPTSALVDLFYGESVTGNVINSMFKAICKSTYVFDLASNTHVQMGVTGAATTAAGWLKVLVEGVVRYINLWSTAPA